MLQGAWFTLLAGPFVTFSITEHASTVISCISGQVETMGRKAVLPRNKSKQVKFL